MSTAAARALKPSWRERLANWISPAHDLNRRIATNQPLKAARHAQALYDGARRGARTQFWRRSLNDANAESYGQTETLRAVARDLVRNNSYASAAVAAIAQNMVGAGIQPQIKAPSMGRTKRLQEMAKRHFMSSDIDADGRHDLAGLQELVMRAVVESGECLIRRRRRRSSDGYAVPFQVQVMEPDFLDILRDGDLENGNIAVQGVEFDRMGRRVAYWLYERHPGSIGAGRGSMMTLKSNPISASEIIHVYRVDRPGQVRGVSWFAPVMTILADRQTYSDAQIVRQQVAACFAAFIRLDQDAEGRLDENGEPLGESALGAPLEGLEPGTIQHLDAGESIDFADPPSVEGFAEVNSELLREVAAGLRMPYTVLTGDLTGVNFSSGRMGWLEFQRALGSWHQKILKPTLLETLTKWFLEGAELMGERGAMAASIEWIPPRREMIDPAKEIAASKDAIRNGVSSRTQEARRFGHDPEDIEAEIAGDNDRADELGLIFDHDARKVTAQGQQQSVEGSDDDNSDERGGNRDDDRRRTG